MKGDSLFKELSDYIDFFLLEKKNRLIVLLSG